MHKNKKTIGLIAGIICLLIVCITGFFLLRSTTSKEEKAWEGYTKALQSKDYEVMYSYISSSSKQVFDKDTFVKKYTNIFNGIQADHIKIETKDIISEDHKTSAVYHVEMDSIAGKISFDQIMEMEEEDGQFYMNWNFAQIFPQMEEGDGIQVIPVAAPRGSIMDRNGLKMAKDGVVLTVGIVPDAMIQKDETIKAVAKALDVSVEGVEKALQATWVKGNMFVPIKTITEKSNAVTELSNIKGVQLQKTTGRVYPYGDITGHLTGYVQNINAEELEKHKNQGYDESSVIGKTGLEAIYEKKLHGVDGIEIQVVNNGIKKDIIVKRDVQNGSDIKTTIDITQQEHIFNQLKKDEAAGVAMNPKTGEVLALVSTPSYDPNDFALGLSTKQWNALNNNPKKPLENRFVQTLCPGSTFKPITGAIGLDTKTITANDDLGAANNRKWQKDKSWGDYFIRTTQAYDGSANLENALIYSDNTYFAKLVLNIGKDAYIKGLHAFGFQEKPDFPFAIAASSYGDSEALDSDITLADTGYGQGKLLVSPLHLTAMYTAFVNNGSMSKPYLLYDEGKAQIWKKDVMTAQTANTLRKDLITTFSNYANKTTVTGGKTGTAEVNKKELGWLSAVKDDLAITIMIDQVQDKGESSYIIPMMVSLME